MTDGAERIQPVRAAAASVAAVPTVVPAQAMPAAAPRLWPVRSADVSILDRWNGWKALSSVARPEVDADGCIHADGRGLGTKHGKQLRYVAEALINHFEGRPDVAVEMDTFMHFGRRGTRSFLGPDVFVTFGVAPDERLLSHRTRDRGLPSFVLEVLSDSTRGNDLGPKRDVYEALGVQEYWLHDLWGRWMQGVRLRRNVLAGGVYRTEELRTGETAEHGRMLASRALGLELGVTAKGDVTMRDPATGRFLLTFGGHVLRADKAEAGLAVEARRADDEARRADKAEAGRAAEAEQRVKAEASLAAEAEQRVKAQAGLAAEAEQRVKAQAALAAEAERRAKTEVDLAAAAKRAARAESQLAELKKRLGQTPRE